MVVERNEVSLKGRLVTGLGHRERKPVALLVAENAVVAQRYSTAFLPAVLKGVQRVIG